MCPNHNWATILVLKKSTVSVCFQSNQNNEKSHINVLRTLFKFIFYVRMMSCYACNCPQDTLIVMKYAIFISLTTKCCCVISLCSNHCTSSGVCKLHGKHAHITGNLYTSCQTRIYHGERAYIMSNTHTSWETCIYHGKHAYIIGDVHTSTKIQPFINTNTAVYQLKYSRLST